MKQAILIILLTSTIFSASNFETICTVTNSIPIYKTSTDGTKRITEYTNYFVYKNIEYIKTTSTPMKTITVVDKEGRKKFEEQKKQKQIMEQQKKAKKLEEQKKQRELKEQKRQIELKKQKREKELKKAREKEQNIDIKTFILNMEKKFNEL